jgi:hypothetical protein
VCILTNESFSFYLIVKVWVFLVYDEKEGNEIHRDHINISLVDVVKSWARSFLRIENNSQIGCEIWDEHQDCRKAAILRKNYFKKFLICYLIEGYLKISRLNSVKNRRINKFISKMQSSVIFSCYWQVSLSSFDSNRNTNKLAVHIFTYLFEISKGKIMITSISIS